MNKLKGLDVNLIQGCIICFSLLLTACNSFYKPNTIYELGIQNLNHPAEHIFVTAQPTKEELKQVAGLGVKHVINLRPISEQPWDERAFVESLNLQYHSLPVFGVKGVTLENAEKLAEILQSIGDEPVLLHCASGNRVGALIALHEAQLEQQPTQEAIAEGRRWGLTSLEKVVRRVLAE